MDGKNYYLQANYGLSRVNGGWQNVKRVSERYALNMGLAIINQLKKLN